MRLFVLTGLLLASSGLFAQNEPVDWDMVARIRAEAFNKSEVMDILHHLTDEIGPRLTNSPSMTKANEYTKKQLEEWGIKAELEAFPFGRGWSFDHTSVHLLSPRRMPLLALPKAWTPGTDGTVRAKVLYAAIESEEDMEKWDGKLEGKIVFISEARAYKHKDTPHVERYSHAELDDLCNFEIPEDRRRGGRSGRWAKYMALREKMRTYFKEQGVVATISISSRDDGIIRVMGGGSYKEGEDPGVPSLVMGAEHYNMVLRRIEEEKDVEMEVNVVARFHDEDMNGYNTIGEIPGTDKADEIVMAGAHLDSWHAAAGAMDNGVGVAVVMEAMRILKALDIKPRRTIRVGLWSGEEQGLHGSREHVGYHYADWVVPEDLKDASDMMKRWRSKPAPKADHSKFSAYYNLDNGGGKIRGIYTQNNGAIVPIFKAWLEPFKDVDSGWVTQRNTGGTDHQSFDRAGLPGFQFIQDELSYSAKNHHTNIDVYDHVIPADLKQASAVMASFIYHTAQREERLPRKHIEFAEVEAKDGKKGKKKRKKGKSRNNSAD